MGDPEHDRLNLAMERDHLAAAEKDLAEGGQRIAKQAALLDRLRRDGRDTAQAESFLRTLEQTLLIWRDHRDEILRAIARLEEKLA